MTDHNPSEFDVLMDRRIETLRSSPVPEGPSQAVIAATLARLETLQTPARPGLRERGRQFWETLMFLSRQPLIRMAFVVALCAGVYLLMFSPFGASNAYADVVAKIKDAATLTGKLSIASPDLRQEWVLKFYVRGTHSRVEHQDGTINIRNGGSSLVLQPARRIATRTEVVGGDGPPNESPVPDIATWVRQLGDANAKPLGEKMIDGVLARGFESTVLDKTVTIWADAKSSFPVRIEWFQPIGSKMVTMSLSDIKTDVPLDESLFSLDVPAGYTLQNQTIKLPAIGDVEDEVAKLLGEYAKLTNGTFPIELTDWTAFIKTNANASPEAQAEMAGRLGAVSGKLVGLPNGYGYAGKNARLGDKEKIIFWLKPAAGAETVKAVFADLRVADVDVKSLPLESVR